MVRRSSRLQQKTEKIKLQESNDVEVQLLTPPDSTNRDLVETRAHKPKSQTPSRPVRNTRSTTKSQDVPTYKKQSLTPSSRKRNAETVGSFSDSEVQELSDDSDFTPNSSPINITKQKSIKSVASSELNSPSTSKTTSRKPRNPPKKSKSSKITRVKTEESSESSYEPSAQETDNEPIDSGEPLSEQIPTTRNARNTKNRSKRAKKPKLSAKERVRLIHPELDGIWTQLDNDPMIAAEEIDQPADLKLPLLPFQKEGVNWMIKQEQTYFGGGILADEMGMGKTIQMIGLLLAEPRIKPNLIVAPTVALIQWSNEIKAHTTTLSTYIFHGSNRTEDIEELMNYDVVLTTYNIMENSFRKQVYGNKKNGVAIKTPSTIHKINWARLILDEAHYIKDRSCNTARSAFMISSNYKWSLSGTPLQNRVGELYSQIRLLKAEPFSYYFCKKCPCKSLSWKFHNGRDCVECGHKPMSHFCWWNAEILRPIQNFGGRGDGKIAYEKLGKLLDRVMLRRTKLEKAKDLGLPPRVVKIRKDVFNEEEEDMYESLYTSSKRKFTTYVHDGTVLNNYANIFELITKMRLAVNHPDLILKRIPPKESGKQALTEISNKMVCSICQDEAEDPIMAKCKHIFCREDIRQYIETSFENNPKCPACFVPITIDLAQPTFNQQDDEKQLQEGERLRNKRVSGQDFRTSIVNRIDMTTWRSSTKIEALVEELHKLRSQDHTIKSIVFSQFVNFLDLVNWRLHRAGFACCRLDGRMQPAQRDAVIRTFMERHEFTVFLISLKAGGIALNLTEASHVFICDPWWNPAVEDQAMDRIHRLGQNRPICVTRLIVENSIESRIIQLQDKKKALFQSTIGKDMSALSRLSEDDLRFLFVL